jgi:probable HAF family extracellular repeat protein
MTAAGTSGAQQYEIRAVKGLPGAYESTIHQINVEGQIVGISRFAEGPAKAFLVSQGQVLEVGNLGKEATSISINDNGQVVGTSFDEGNKPAAFKWTPSTGIQRLFPHRVRSYANHINNAGSIVGSYDGKPYAIRNGVFKLLQPVYPETFSTAVAINEAGVVIGRNAVGEWPVAIRWVDDVPTVLSGGLAMWPAEINESGQIAGYYFSYYSHTEKPVTWSSTNQLTYLPSFIGVGMAFSINEAGDMVGYVTDRNWQYHVACLWKNGQMIVLQTLLNNPDWTLWAGTRILDDGRIVGRGRYRGRNTPFILTPIGD